MINDPCATKSEIATLISTKKVELDEFAKEGDKIKSSGAQVDYNHRYNKIKQDLEELYSMKANLVARGEW